MKIASRQQRTTYLVDSENVNDAWTRLLPELKKRDRVIIFYTENTPNVSAESVRMLTEYKEYDVTWEKCFTGSNALDFQLVSRLGYYICQQPKDVYVIVSNDNGYDAVVKYWTRAGVAIDRLRRVAGGAYRKEPQKYLPGPAPANQQMALTDKQQTEKKSFFARWRGAKEENVSEHAVESDTEKNLVGRPAGNKGAAEHMPGSGDAAKNNGAVGRLGGKPGHVGAAGSGRKTDPAAGQPENGTTPEPMEGTETQEQEEFKIPVNCVLGICRSVSIKKLDWVHEALVALLGAENGREVYYFLKENREFHGKLRTIYLKNQDQRMVNYVQVVLEYHNLEIERTQEVKKLMLDHLRGNYNDLYRSLIRKFGKGQGGQYYAVLKPHIHIMRRM